MPPRSSTRTRTTTRSWWVAARATALALVVSGTLLSAPAYAANPVTPGDYTGLGFDQCEAPTQSAMSAWISRSPFRAAGIYISGASRACQRQSNLTATWVSNQLTAGWHLMPITLGPQASCSTRYPRYGKNIDPTIIPSTTNTYAAARTQAVLEARKAVAAAGNLGIVPGSTIFYDLEAFSSGSTTACTQSALWYLSSWTTELHRLGYASGYYSSAASGIRMLDNARVQAGNRIVMPDQLWIADWDGMANTTSAYVRSDGWQPYRRAKQYQGGHNETWGGVTINIDRDYLDLRTPAIPGVSAPAASGSQSGPKYTGASLADRRCTPSTLNRRSYGPTNARVAPRRIAGLQCLLKQRGLYRYQVTAHWNPQTTTALNGFQRAVGHSPRTFASRSDWVSLLVTGNQGTLLRAGSRGGDVVRVQRALNAAGSPHLRISGVYNTATRKAVGAYQRRVGISPTRVVSSYTWAALRAGRR